MIEKITGFFDEGEIGRVILKDLFFILLIGGILFGVSGVWPPLVAIESGSMEPNLHRGDLVFIMDVKEVENGGLSITTREGGRGNYKFGEVGDVIVFNADGNSNIPVIHRVEFLVEEGEDWYGRGNPNWVVGKGCGSSPPAKNMQFNLRVISLILRMLVPVVRVPASGR